MATKREIKVTEVTDRYGDCFLDFSLKELFDELQKEFKDAVYIDNSSYEQADGIMIKGNFGYFTLEKYCGGSYQPERSLKMEIIGVSERDNTSKLIKDYYLKEKVEVERKIYKNYLTGAIEFIKENIHIINDQSHFENGL